LALFGARHGTGGGGDDEGELQEDRDILEAGLEAMVVIKREGNAAAEALVIVPVAALYASGWCFLGSGGVDFGLAGSRGGRLFRMASGEEMGERTAHLLSGMLDDSTDANCGDTTWKNCWPLLTGGGVGFCMAGWDSSLVLRFDDWAEEETAAGTVIAGLPASSLIYRKQSRTVNRLGSMN